MIVPLQINDRAATQVTIPKIIKLKKHCELNDQEALIRIQINCVIYNRVTDRNYYNYSWNIITFYLMNISK